ncbi:MAG: SDR family NAD(P)-dependent oxidoreductase [Microlunatus sp.]|nr:SDR family NAD(P)-dependent oxidoreductase [Microlunatus sp.]MDN5771161.1 SDR family NAD(P)-dependent oxidoreductase [Microlunatus sp.]MDN5805358.1 SDR family NAD(P)-dependent oxidoreductase [Microlunatus sp.]
MSDCRTIVITGATDGLGRAVALSLAADGHRLILHGRRSEALAALADEVGATGTEKPAIVVADLSSLAEVHTLPDQIGAVTDHVDVLVNNAGVGGGEPDGHDRRLTVDGHELRFAVNYLAPFDLTHRLLPQITDGGRVVNVASLGQAPVRFDDLSSEHGYDGWLAYNRSKLALITWGFTLAERQHRVSVNSLHPGTYMPTKMVLDNAISQIHTLKSGVEATTRLIVDPGLEGVTGRFYDRLRQTPAHVDQAYDRSVRERLWQLSLELTGAPEPACSAPA